MQQQKRVLAIHDISCFGRCSLTVALPILSAAGIETSVIPTAILSTHTGGFSGYTYRDLTGDILPIAEHWQSIGIGFDGLYTGFLGSFEQIDIVAEVFERFKTPDNLIVVDPVMADHGALYKTFDASFPSGMRKLCEKADIIVPNITEAALLLGWPYQEGPYARAYIERMLRGLAAIGPKQVVLTGVNFLNDHLGAACYDHELGRIDYVFSERIEGFYHGTGDVFASALTAALMRGHGIADAARIAVDFTVSGILRTKQRGGDIRYGIDFEQGIQPFLRQLDGR